MTNHDDDGWLYDTDYLQPPLWRKPHRTNWLPMTILVVLGTITIAWLARPSWLSGIGVLALWGGYVTIQLWAGRYEQENKL